MQSVPSDFKRRVNVFCLTVSYRIVTFDLTGAYVLERGLIFVTLAACLPTISLYFIP